MIPRNIFFRTNLYEKLELASKVRIFLLKALEESVLLVEIHFAQCRSTPQKERHQLHNAIQTLRILRGKNCKKFARWQKTIDKKSLFKTTKTLTVSLLATERKWGRS